MVTGAAADFGQLACKKTAVLSARIAAADINSEAQHIVVDGIVGNGGQAIAVQADVASREDMHSLASAAVDHFGQIDVMLNNADITQTHFSRRGSRHRG